MMPSFSFEYFFSWFVYFVVFSSFVYWVSFSLLFSI